MEWDLPRLSRSGSGEPVNEKSLYVRAMASSTMRRRRENGEEEEEGKGGEEGDKVLVW